MTEAELRGDEGSKGGGRFYGKPNPLRTTCGQIFGGLVLFWRCYQPHEAKPEIRFYTALKASVKGDTGPSV